MAARRHHEDSRESRLAAVAELKFPIDAVAKSIGTSRSPVERLLGRGQRGFTR